MSKTNCPHTPKCSKGYCWADKTGQKPAPDNVVAGMIAKEISCAETAEFYKKQLEAARKEIEELKDKVALLEYQPKDALRAKVEELEKARISACDEIAKMQYEANKAQARIRDLEWALREIAHVPPGIDVCAENIIAKQALSGEERGDG